MSGITNVNTGLTVQQVTGGFDLEAFLMQVQAQRANNLESQLAMQVDEVKQRQAEIERLTKMLADLRAAEPDSGDGNKVWMSCTTADTVRKELGGKYWDGSFEWDKWKCDGQEGKFGDSKGGVFKASKATVRFTKPQHESMVEALKAKIDSLNSTSQLDMIRLQNLSNKRNEAFDQLSNIMQKLAKGRETVVGNMR